MEMIVIHAKEQSLIVGSSKAIKHVLEQCRHMAGTNHTVLFRGEVGTGKQLLASYVHQISPRSKSPFCIVDCSNPSGLLDRLFSDTLQESEWQFLIGGTIYFNEIAGLNIEQQKKLYTFCKWAQQNDIRTFMSTAQNIDLLLFDKAFDKELYELGTRKEIVVPPLRQRMEDISELVALFLDRLNRKLRKSIHGLTPQVEEMFMNYRWPQNIEELKYILTRAAIVANEPYIGQRHLNDSLGQMGHDPLQSYDVMPLERMEEILLRSALNRYGYSLEGKKSAARSLNISLATLYNKLKRYHLNA